MKSIITLFLSFIIFPILRGQNVGIGTTNPIARLHVADSAVLFSGAFSMPPTTDIPPPVQGTGARMMWYPAKAAFRTGYAAYNQWDKDNIGFYSFAAGFSSVASGNASFAFGDTAVASGTRSVALGFYTRASGHSSFATGLNTRALGDISTAMGDSSVASGGRSTAIGVFTLASGDVSTALGVFTKSTSYASFTAGYNSMATAPLSTAMGDSALASGIRSTAFGNRTTASGELSTAMGSLSVATGYVATAIGDITTATGAYSTAMGRITKAYGESSTATGEVTYTRTRGGFVAGVYNDSLDTPDNIIPAPTDRLFQLGNGADHFNRSNALTILRNARLGIGTVNPLARLHVADSSVVFTAAAVLPSSPENPPVSGAGNRMMWYADKASFRAGNVINTSWDKNNIGNISFAVGSNTQASGITSFAAGNFAFATGDISTAIGNSVFAKAKTSFAAGTFNDNIDSPNPTIEAATDRIFQVGNGSGNLSRSNAMTILRNGKVGIGNTNPVNRLDVAGIDGWDVVLGEGDMRIGNNSYRLKFGVALTGGGAGVANIMQYGQPGGYNVLSLGAQGNQVLYVNGALASVGIGTDNPTQKLTVIGNVLANSYTIPSDRRYKTDIQPLQSTLQKLQGIHGVSYHYNAEAFPKMGFTDEAQIGFIAQEVEQVFPEMVNTDNKGFKSVDYQKMIPVLVEAIKDQQKQIETQQKQIDELKAILNSKK